MRAADPMERGAKVFLYESGARKSAAGWVISPHSPRHKVANVDSAPHMALDAHSRPERGRVWGYVPPSSRQPPVSRLLRGVSS